MTVPVPLVTVKMPVKLVVRPVVAVPVARCRMFVLPAVVAQVMRISLVCRLMDRLGGCKTKTTKELRALFTKVAGPLVNK